TAKIKWLPEERTDVTADEALGKVKQPIVRVDAAVDFLNDLLGWGPVPAEGMKQRAKEAGISRRALQSAQQEAGVKWRRPGGTRGLWEVYLGSEPVVEEGQQPSRGGQQRGLAVVDQSSLSTISATPFWSTTKKSPTSTTPLLANNVV